MTTRRVLAAIAAGAAAAAGVLAVGLSAPAGAAPPLPGQPCTSITPGAPITVPGDFIAGASGTLSKGHYEVVPAGLRVYTDDSSGQAKVAEYVTVPPTNLSLAGEPALGWTPTSGTTPPGFQLMVDLENDGTSDGILVGEPSYYGNRWWASSALVAHIGTPVPPALVSPGGDGGPVAGTLADWSTAYPQATVRAIGFSLGSGVQGDGVISGLTFGCVSHGFQATPPPTPIVFAQTELFGSVVAGSPATATYTLTSGPNGRAAEDGTVLVGIDDVSAAEIASCTVAIDGGPAEPIVIEYDPMLGGIQYSGALLHVASGLPVESDSTVTLALACQTTAAAVTGAYGLVSVWFYSEDEGQDLVDILTITAPVTVPPPTNIPPTTVAPSTPALAATGPAQAQSLLLAGGLVLVVGITLLVAGTARRSGADRRH